MLAIKLKRTGKKNQAMFRIVVAERRSKLNGRPVEDLGWLNPHLKTLDVKKDRVLHWLSVGAQATPTVHNLLVKTGVVKTKKIAVHKKSKKTKEGETPAAPAPQAAS